MFQLQLFFLLHCDEWDRVVALSRHKFVTGATLLQLDVTSNRIDNSIDKKICVVHILGGISTIKQMKN